MFKVLVLAATVASCISCATGSSQGFQPTKSLAIDDNTVATDLIPAGTVRSEIECLTKCPQDRNCIAVRFNTVTGVCDVRVAHRITKAPVGSLVGLNVSVDSPFTMWTNSNLTAELQDLKFGAFQYTGTGRSGSIQTFTAPATACYLIRAFGARGGTHWTVYDGSPSTTFPARFWYGGLGAYKTGRFQLSEGTQLSIVVGQSGGNSTEMTPGYPTYPEDNAGTGGGGGSFVYRTSDNFLYLAAGGGGGGSNGYHGVAGQSGINGTSSVGATASQSSPGGTNGNPGETTQPGSYHGGPGAGWNGKFATARSGSYYGDRGGGLSDGWVGGLSGGKNPGAVGGFGGGGGGSEDNGASGGGGGFSGGGAGSHSKQAGGGGGSFCAGVACDGSTGGNTGSDQGLVSVQLIGLACN